MAPASAQTLASESDSRVALTFIAVSALFGIGFTAISVTIKISMSKKRKRCTMSVMATITDIIREQSTNSDDSFVSFHPVYEYTVQNVTYRRKSSFGGSGRGFGIGQRVEILVNPDNPSEYYNAKEKFNLVYTAFLIMGIVFLVVAAVLIYYTNPSFLGLF